MFGRPAPVPVLPPVLADLREHLKSLEIEQRPSRWARLRSFAWTRRRSHGLPLAVGFGVWLVSLWVRSTVGPPAWLVMLAGWGFVVTVYFRARGQHLIHTMACAVFIAVWLSAVSLHVG